MGRDPPELPSPYAKPPPVDMRVLDPRAVTEPSPLPPGVKRGRQWWRRVWYGQIRQWRGLAVQRCSQCEAARGFKPSPPPRPRYAALGPRPSRVKWVRCVVCGTVARDQSAIYKKHFTSAAVPSQAALRAAYRAEAERDVLFGSQLRRTYPIVAILALLASIAVPWRVAPSGAVIVALGILALVAFSAGSEWRRKHLVYPRAQQALEKILRRNEKALTQMLTSEEASDTVRYERATLRQAVPLSWRKQFDREGYVPTWPLPTEAVKRIQDDLESFNLMKWFHPFHAAARLAFWCLASSIAAFLFVWANQPASCNIAAQVCSGAIAGLDVRPPIGSFPYLTFNAVMFHNTPSDIGPRSLAAHLVMVATSVAGFVVIGIIGSRLWQRMRADTASRPRERS